MKDLNFPSHNITQKSDMHYLNFLSKFLQRGNIVETFSNLPQSQ